MSSHFIVVHYVKDNKFTVVIDELNKLKNSLKAQIEVQKGVWKTGDIVFRGTKKACDAYCNLKLVDVDFEYTDEEILFKPVDSRDKTSKLNK